MHEHSPQLKVTGAQIFEESEATNGIPKRNGLYALTVKIYNVPKNIECVNNLKICYNCWFS